MGSFWDGASQTSMERGVLWAHGIERGYPVSCSLLLSQYPPCTLLLSIFSPCSYIFNFFPCSFFIFYAPRSFSIFLLSPGFFLWFVLEFLGLLAPELSFACSLLLYLFYGLLLTPCEKQSMFPTPILPLTVNPRGGIIQFLDSCTHNPSRLYNYLSLNYFAMFWIKWDLVGWVLSEIRFSERTRQ